MALHRYIKGYEGLYLAGDNGTVLSLLANPERELKPLDNGKGYLIVYLYKDRIRKMFRISRIIAKTFVPNPNNYKEVNHIRPVKSINAAKNLEWCTRKQNMDHAKENSLIKRITGSDHHGSIQVFRISTNKTYQTITEAAKDTGLTFKMIKNRIKNNNDFITIKK